MSHVNMWFFQKKNNFFLQNFVVVMCQVLGVTHGTVNAKWSCTSVIVKYYCLDFNLVFIYVSLIQFSLYLCLFDSILFQFFNN